MRLVSWNVARSGSRIANQVEWIADLDELPDILLLQEVNLKRREDWQENLINKLGYESIVDTLDWGKELQNSNGHLTAVRNDCGLAQKPIDGETNPGGELASEAFGTEYPEKLLVTDLTYQNLQIECWNVRAVPGSSYPQEKCAILEYIYDQIEADPEKVHIVAGDLNTPKRELADGQAVTYGYHRSGEMQREALSAELDILKGLGHFGMVDVFRMVHGYGDIDRNDTSHNGKRIDHIFASEKLNPTNCRYPSLEHVPSDHAPIIADFDMN
jgi:exonuclease III